MNNIERHLADILAALLRIEAKMDAAKAADTDADADTVAFYIKQMERRRQTLPVMQPQPVPLPGMPEPPIAPVRPMTTWQGPQATAVDPAPRTWMHGGWIHATGFSMVGP